MSEEALLDALRTAVGADRVPILAELVRSYASPTDGQTRIRAEEALEIAMAGADARLLASAYSAMTCASFLEDDMAGVAGHGQKALEFYGAGPASYGFLDALLLVGIEHRRRGDLTGAIELTTRGLGISQALGDKVQEASANSNLGLMYVDLTDFDRGLEHFTAALEALGKEVDPSIASLQAGIYNNIGLAHRQCERAEEATACFRKGWECVEGVGSDVEAHVLANYAGSLRRMEQLDECRKASERAVTIYEKLGGATNLGLAARLLGDLELDRDDPDAACEHFERGLTRFLEGAHSRMATVCRIAAAECHSRAGRNERAVQLLDDAEAWARGASVGLLRLKAYDGKVKHWERRADFPTALEEAKRARELAVQLAESGATRQTEALRARIMQQQHEHETELLKRRTDELEVLVSARTAELQATNERLRTEVEKHKRTAEDLLVARDKAEVADRAKTTFLAVASHELRTPLNAIKGYTEMISDDLDVGIPTEEIQADLGRILGSTDRLMATVQRILSMADLEAGAKVAASVPFDPKRLAQKIVADCQVRAGLGNNELLLDSDGVTGDVCGDPDKIGQILHNLLDNATKFTKDGRIDVVASTTVVDARPTLRLEVRDTGMGFEPAAFEQLTASFTQHDNSYRRQFDGLGLGLAIVRRYCEILDGEFDVRSAPGEGASFLVILPVEVLVS